MSGDLARRRRPRPLRAEVVLDVAGAAFGVGDDSLQRALALELAQDRLVRAAEHVGEDVQPAAVRHAEHDLVRALLGGEPDRLVEHRHHHVEALDRELLLAEEGAAEVTLEALDLGQALEQAPLLVGSSGWRYRPDSITARSQTRCSWSEMCSISYALVPQ